MQVGCLVFDTKGQEFGDFHLYFSLFCLEVVNTSSVWDQKKFCVHFSNSQPTRHVERKRVFQVADCQQIMSPIESNLQHVHTQINDAIAALSLASQRPVALVAVTKTRSIVEIRSAFASGQRNFGENYVQEAVGKIESLRDLKAQDIVWHFIGPLQSNKSKLIATNFDWVHGIDRLRVASALSRHRSGCGALNVCVQVNVSGEQSKSGVAPGDALALATQVRQLPGLKLRGLMTIIENTVDETAQRAQFSMMRTLFEKMKSDNMDVDTLSMGMSQDFSIAISEGATMVRVGSAIFGARQ